MGNVCRDPRRTGRFGAGTIGTMTAESPVAERSPLRAWVAPVLALLFLVGVVITLLFVAIATQDDALPPDPGPFVPPASANPTLSFDVERAEAGVLALAIGQDTAREELEVTLVETDSVEFLELIEPSAVNVGDWATVIGVKNDVRNFSVKMVLVVAGGGEPDADGWLRTGTGFLGHEAARDAREVPIFAGRVAEVRENELVIDSGASLVIAVNPGGPLRMLRSGAPAEIADGDRIALHQRADGEGDTSGGILVLVGGAQ